MVSKEEDYSLERAKEHFKKHYCHIRILSTCNFRSQKTPQKAGFLQLKLSACLTEDQNRREERSGCDQGRDGHIDILKYEKAENVRILTMKTIRLT